MAKRKLEVIAPSTPPSKRLPGSILKTEKTPTSQKKNVSFPPPAELSDTLKMFSRSDGVIDDADLSNMIGLVDTLKGQSLVMWLAELQKNVAALGRHKNEKMESFVTELLKLKWAGQGEAVSNAYTAFLANLVSANTKFVKPAVKFIIENFKGGDRDLDSEVFKNSHSALRSLLVIAPVIARDEILHQIQNKFPYYKMPTYRQVCYISAVLEMIGYLPDSRDHILRLLVEKLIKLDAHLSRDFIDDAYRESRESEEKKDVNNQVQALDLFMKLMFTFLDMECHDLDGVFKDEKAAPVVDSMMRVFSSHILPTFNILHTQFLYLYLASLSPNISNRFLQENWRIFSNPNTPSILRQTAVAYIASFLSRASFVNVNTVMNYLDRLTQWALTYVRTREASSSGMDFMYTDLNHHGPFYAACQAIFYVFAFRHSELTPSETRMKTLQAMSWQTLISSHLNPLRVCLPGVVSNFSAIAKRYQLAYCNSIIQRNNRINLPVVGSLSSASAGAKPLLLDCFFPFDPFILDESKVYVSEIYRPFAGEVFDDDDLSQNDDEEDDVETEDESDQESNDTPDSGLGRRRTRKDSMRSSVSSNCSKRSRKDSVGNLNDILMQDLNSPGFQ